MNVFDNIRLKLDTFHGTIPENWTANDKPNAYTATIHYKGRKLSTPFFTGSGWKTKPTAKDVVYSLIMDARAYSDSTNFEDFCSNFGYTYETGVERSRIMKTYKACERTANAVENLFGEDLEIVEKAVENY